MKKLRISTIINDFGGEPILSDKRPLTIKDVILNHIGTFASKNGKEVIRLSKLGHKVYDHVTPYIDLEDAEFELLEKVLAEPRMSVLAVAPVFEAMESAKKGNDDAGEASDQLGE